MEKFVELFTGGLTLGTYGADGDQRQMCESSFDRLPFGSQIFGLGVLVWQPDFRPWRSGLAITVGKEVKQLFEKYSN